MAEDFSLPDYRRAIAINNCGVSLLQRQAYSQAMGTFKDAIFVMKSGLRPTSSSSGPPFNCDAEERVNRAAKLLAGHKRQCSVSPVFPIRFEGGHVDLASALPFMGEFVSSVMITPVHIEIADFECLLERDTDLDSAIMLYNFALAHAALAGQQLESSPATAMKLKAGAVSILEMASKIIMDDSSMNIKNLETGVDLVRQNRLQVSFMVEWARVQILVALGEYSAANDIMEHLTNLEDEVVEMMDTTEDMAAGAVCAAAAA